MSAAHHFENTANLLQQLARSPNLPTGEALLLAAASQQLDAGAKALPQTEPKNVPITIGVGEPVTTTLTVCFYAAILLTLRSCSTRYTRSSYRRSARRSGGWRDRW